MATLVAAILVGFVGSIPAAGPLAWLLASTAARGDRAGALRLALGGALAESLWAALAAASHAEVASWLSGRAALLDAALGAVLIAVGAATMRGPRAPSSGRAASVAGVAAGFSIVALNPTFYLFWLAAWRVVGGRVGVTPASGAAALGAFVGVAAWFAALAEISRRVGVLVGDRRLSLAARVVGVALVCVGAWSLLSAARAILDSR